MVRCDRKEHDVLPCVIEDGPSAYDEQACCRTCRRDDGAITAELIERGHEPVRPEEHAAHG